MNTVVDARERFKSDHQRYVVTIKVKVVPRFLWAVLKAALSRKDLSITHTFNCDPFSMNSTEG